MYPTLRNFSLWFHTSLTGSYVSGTYSIVFVNCPNEQIARDIARAILDKKLAASVNILPKTSSLLAAEVQRTPASPQRLTPETLRRLRSRTPSNLVNSRTLKDEDRILGPGSTESRAIAARTSD
ncbi:hypothetical protein HispidOSU_001892 [Sigmodon hispidus]